MTRIAYPRAPPSKAARWRDAPEGNVGECDDGSAEFGVAELGPEFEPEFKPGARKPQPNAGWVEMAEVAEPGALPVLATRPGDLGVTTLLAFAAASEEDGTDLHKMHSQETFVAPDNRASAVGR